MIKITSHASEVSLMMHLPVVYTFYWSFLLVFFIGLLNRPFRFQIIGDIL